MSINFSTSQAIKIYITSIVLFFVACFVYASIPSVLRRGQGDLQNMSVSEDVKDTLQPSYEQDFASYENGSYGEFENAKNEVTELEYKNVKKDKEDGIDEPVVESIDNKEPKPIVDNLDNTETIIEKIENTETINKLNETTEAIVDTNENIEMIENTVKAIIIEGVGTIDETKDTTENIIEIADNNSEQIVEINESKENSININETSEPVFETNMKDEHIVAETVVNVKIDITNTTLEVDTVYETNEGSGDEIFDDHIEEGFSFEENEIFTDVLSDNDGEAIIDTNVAAADNQVVDVSAHFSDSELLQLIESDEFESFNTAIKNINNIDQIWNEKGLNLLHCAASKCSAKFINAILAGRSPNGLVEETTRDVNNKTAVHLVVENSKEKSVEEISEVLSILIQNGADINAVSGAGHTAIYSAIINNNLKVIEALLIKDADANVVYEGLTLLHHSFNHCGIEGIDLLLKHGANPLIVNKHNRTALHEAVVKNKPEIISLLIDTHKCNVNTRTPSKSDLKTLNKKELRKADVLYDATPLHYAVKQGNPSVASFLIKKGADEDAKDSYGKKAWFYDDYEIMSLVGYMTSK